MASRQQQVLCSECDASAAWYCVQDNANFCDEHNIVAHSLKSQKSHKIISIDDKNIVDDDQVAKPMNCKSHHMPLCLYCLSCKEVCCVACLSVDIHKQHSDQVKSVVDVADGERKILRKHLEKLQKLEGTLIDEQDQLQQALRNIDISESESEQKIDREFDRLIACVEARQKILKKQLEKKFKISRNNIFAKEDDLKNIYSNLNKCLEEGQRVLELDDFNALSHSQNTIEKIKILEMENAEYCKQTLLRNSLSVYISSQSLLEMINSLGSVGMPPAPSFIEQKCKANVTDLYVEWAPVEYSPSITAYILELGQDNPDFKEVYRGLDTRYYLEGLKPNTLYSLYLYVCNEGEIGTPTILQMKTLDIDLNNWTLSMSSTYPPAGAENTRESLLDGQFTTGAATDSGHAWIKASFPYPVSVNSVTIAPFHKTLGWGPTNGTSGSLQYSNDNINWRTVGTISYVPMETQKIIVSGVTAQYWRLSHNNYLGTSSFVFQ